MHVERESIDEGRELGLERGEPIVAGTLPSNAEEEDRWVVQVQTADPLLHRRVAALADKRMMDCPDRGSLIEGLTYTASVVVVVV